MSEESATTVLVAVASGVGALIGIFITASLGHARATLELRQNWINSLREVLARFLTESQKYVDVADQDTKERYEQKIALMATVHQAKLYLNQREEVSGELLKVMEAVYKNYAGDSHASRDYESEKASISKSMQSILKSEWNRVRDGEVLWSFNEFTHKRLCVPQRFYLSRIRVFWLSLLIVGIAVWWAVR